MKCADCRFRDTEGTLDTCPRFGKRYLNGAIIGLMGGGIEIIECEQGEAAMKRAAPLVPSVSFPPIDSRARVSSPVLQA